MHPVNQFEMIEGQWFFYVVAVSTLVTTTSTLPLLVICGPVVRDCGAHTQETLRRLIGLTVSDRVLVIPRGSRCQ